MKTESIQEIIWLDVFIWLQESNDLHVFLICLRDTSFNCVFRSGSDRSSWKIVFLNFRKNSLFFLKNFSENFEFLKENQENRRYSIIKIFFQKILGKLFQENSREISREFTKIFSQKIGPARNIKKSCVPVHHFRTFIIFFGSHTRKPLWNKKTWIK